jgi:fructose-1,6-bisphosphatase/inositol monophosphatase family enzyme
VGDARTSPRYVVTCDPFDGSGHFMRGLPAEWWSVLTVWSAEDLRPVLAGAVDILRREMYIADGSGVTVEGLDSGERKAIAPTNHTRLSDDSIVAAYLMNPRYLALWTKQAVGLVSALERRYPRARLWADGGACSYPWLARGLIHAYVMFDEPRSEVDPGLGFAWAAGFPVYSVREDGRLEEYRFAPEESAGRVPWLVAACTRELGEDIVGEILGGRGPGE